MRRILAPLSVLSLLCACSAPQRPDDQFPEVGRIQPSDPVFFQSDPASRKPCKADADCGGGNLCHPGHGACMAAYPTPRMLNISFASPQDAAQCRPVNVYFPFDSAELVPEAQKWLDLNYRCFLARGVRHVIVEAHCDARGDIEYNLALSRRRGEAIRGFLAGLGLKVPIDVVPLGKGEPALNKGTMTESEHAWNRRAEFRIE